MNQEPPGQFVELLERLGLATPSQVRGTVGLARRLAKDLPLFESVWVDALCRARVLTPYQAGEINACRGDRLRLGSYVIQRPLPDPGYCQCLLARHSETREAVQLSVLPAGCDRTEGIQGSLEALTQKGRQLDSRHLAPIIDTGAEEDRVWAASRHMLGTTAAELVIRNGRFPPEVVLEIARQMLEGLKALERADSCHGDISAVGTVLTESGDVILHQPGLRSVFRPDEGYASCELPPESYDYVAPERVAYGMPPSAESDVYACGCLWWHLLTGRAPLPGGSSLAKLRSIQESVIPDVRQLAPDTPRCLAEAIVSCVRPVPSQRPDSVTSLAQTLVPSTRSGRRRLSQFIRRPGHRAGGLARSVPKLELTKSHTFWLAVTTGCIVAAGAVFWSLWKRVPEDRPSVATASATSQGAHDVLKPADDPPPLLAEPHQATPMPEVSRRTVTPQSDKSSAGPVVSTSHNSVAVQYDDLVLADDGSALISLADQLRPGQTVRASSGRRSLVKVPSTGLSIRPDGIRFESIDFVLGDRTGPKGAGRHPALLHVFAPRAEFHGCSFRCAENLPSAPVAIRWCHPADRRTYESGLPSGRIRFAHCVFRNMHSGVACRTAGGVVVELANVLYLGSGPLMELDHCPRLDEPVLLGLSRVTVRDSGPLLLCPQGQVEGQVGRITIRAAGCAFSLSVGAPLLSFIGPSPPGRLLEAVEWTGQGSIVDPQTLIAGWTSEDGQFRSIDDAAVSIAGLVRSSVTFAGPADGGPDASRLTRWQVPVMSPNPPGIDPQMLTWPRP
jgi:serine/threonine protein kinase